MPRLVLIYRGGSRPEDGRAHMTRWRAWRDGLRDAFVFPGMSFSRTVTVSAQGIAEGGGDVAPAGFSVVEAEDIEAAQEMARTCPHLDLGGDIVVAEGMDVQM